RKAPRQLWRRRHVVPQAACSPNEAAMATALSVAPDFSASMIDLPSRAGVDVSNTESWVHGLLIRNARSTPSRPGITPSEVNWQAGYRYSPDPFGTASRARRRRRLSTAWRVMPRAPDT